MDNLSKQFTELLKSDSLKKWFYEHFNEEWEEIETDIDFSKYEPTDVSNSLHISQYLYEIEDIKYKLSYEIGSENKRPLIERLKK